MPTEAPCPKDAPLMIEWEKYRQTDEFKNSFKWAADLQHRTGSMWAAFAAGALAMNPDAAQSLKLPETAPASTCICPRCSATIVGEMTGPEDETAPAGDAGKLAAELAMPGTQIDILWSTPAGSTDRRALRKSERDLIVARLRAAPHGAPHDPA